jgi:hypothetical protein
VGGRSSRSTTPDIRAYDEGHEHMLMFADTLTDGIAKQFPSQIGK